MTDSESIIPDSIDAASTQPWLADHVAIVTGATSGIGQATARLLVERGARVVLAGRSQSRGEALALELGSRASFHTTDVSDPDAIARLVDACVSQFGRIDSLFNNAGGMGRGASVADLTLDDFDQAIGTLLRSVFVATKLVVPIMQAQGSGSIVNNASIAGTRAGRGTLLYSTAKAAVIHFTRCVAMELGESGTRANSVSPGFIATPMMLGAQSSDDQFSPSMMSLVEATLADESPTRSAGLPLDVARVVLFLIDPTSRFVNGQDIVVDGGASNGLLWRRQHASLTGQGTPESGGNAPS